MILGLDFTESVFMHAVLMVHDFGPTKIHYNQGTDSLSYYFRNYEIYIGDNSNYLRNEKCTGGPHLNPNDVNTYVFSK